MHVLAYRRRAETGVAETDATNSMRVQRQLSWHVGEMISCFHMYSLLHIAHFREESVIS